MIKQKICVLFGLFAISEMANAIMPSAELIVSEGGQSSAPFTLLASSAFFGAELSQDSRESFELKYTELKLCENVTVSNTYDNSILLVPRGDCTYQHKAFQAQQMGAKGIVIYNTLGSRYSVNETKYKGETFPSYSLGDVIFPQPLHDYDCDLGSADIPTSDLEFTPLPYNDKHNDPVLSGDKEENLCLQYSSSSLQNCASKRCLVTDYSPNTTHTKACCAWDLHVWLYGDDSNRDVTIPAVFITMEQGHVLLQTIESGSGVKAIMKARWRPYYNPSSLLTWILGVLVVSFAAYYSAQDYNMGIAKLISGAGRHSKASVGDSASGDEPLGRRNPMQEEKLELEPIHALGFIIMSSSSLLILFYFKPYNLVKVFYTVGCTNAVIQLIIYPVISKVFKRLQIRQYTLFNVEDFGDVSNWHMSAVVLGCCWGIAWLYMALFVPHSDSYTFFWFTQNVMGSCMCIIFLSIIQINSIKVAAILLICAFFYDIFFVFVTPFLFQGKSIMLTVATSGGPPTADPLWCEKYPSDEGCKGGDPLPMLLAVPRLWDYAGGSSLLGLGDIVLPGLLLSFGARFDAAKNLVAVDSTGTLNSGKRGYYFPLVIAYAIGLFMADVAVYVMDMGQPALFYLVPCTLGTIWYLGRKKNELHALWNGPKVLEMADAIVYGTQRPSSSELSIKQIEQTTIESGNEESRNLYANKDDGKDNEVDPLLVAGPKE